MLEGIITVLLFSIISLIFALIRRGATIANARRLMRNCAAGPETTKTFIYKGQSYDEVKFFANCLNATKDIISDNKAATVVALAMSEDRYRQIYAKAFLKNYFEAEIKSEGAGSLEENKVWTALNENNSTPPDIKAMISALPGLQKKMEADAAAAAAENNKHIYESLSNDELLKIIYKKGYKEEAKNLAREILSSRETGTGN